MLDDDKLKSASVNNLAYSLRQVHDMRQIREGLATEHVHYDGLVASISLSESEVSKLGEELSRLQEMKSGMKGANDGSK